MEALVPAILEQKVVILEAHRAWKILLHKFGGPSHLDTFDPKPDAPAGIRGSFGVIPTTVPGIRFSDHLPRLARWTHRTAIVRHLKRLDPPVGVSYAHPFRDARGWAFPGFR